MNNQLVKLSKKNNIIAAFIEHYKLGLIDYNVMLKQLTLTLYEVTNTLIDEFKLRKVINPIQLVKLDDIQIELEYLYLINYIQPHLECLAIYMKSHEVEVNTIKSYIINNDNLNEVNINDIAMLNNLLF